MQELLQACEQAGLMAYEYGRHTQTDPVLGRPEVLICLGGDGTMLGHATFAAQHGITLGGINMDNIRKVKDYGFGGVAIMGAIWNQFNTCTDCDYTQLIEHFKKLKKLVD